MVTSTLTLDHLVRKIEIEMSVIDALCRLFSSISCLFQLFYLFLSWEIAHCGRNDRKRRRTSQSWYEKYTIDGSKLTLHYGNNNKDIAYSPPVPQTSIYAISST